MAAKGYLPGKIDLSRDKARKGDLAGVARFWDCTLNVSLVLWILRVPVATTVVGWLLLGVTPQAQDLFTEFLELSSLSTWLRMLWFVLMLTVAWALPTHYAARMLVDSDRASTSHARQCFKCATIYVPRLLGLLTFLAVEFAIWRSFANLPTLDEIDVIQRVEHALVAMAMLVALGAVAYLIWVLKRPREFKLTGPLGRLNANLGAFWQTVAPGRIEGSRDEQGRDIGRFVLAGVFIVFVTAFLVGADQLAKLFPRAAAIPFILGGWLPFLTFLSGWSRQVRAPLITGLALLIAFFAVVLGDNHSVRGLRSENITRMPIENVVDLWMTENGCNPKTRTTAADCPRPIIFAAAGGASRAGFMMASIMGYFLDTAEAVHYGVEGLKAQDVRKRIFAISSVSGGSMGAAMVAAALNAASPDSDRPPCVNTPVNQWWGRVVNNWRDCFEALTSGDFLTADFLGLAFNDVLPFALRDRAAVLEDSWRNRFAEVVLSARHNDAGLCQGLDCSFLSLRPRLGHWVPLLVLNGTSEATGRRILTTSLDMTYTPHGACLTAVENGSCPLFVNADNFFQLVTTNLTTTGWRDHLGFLERYLDRSAASNDVRVSTAALNSARFPFISPPGSIRGQDGLLVDRIVDGGYFENYGALAAEELALAIIGIAPQLRPLVIVISNDPADLLDPADDVTPNQPSLPRPHAAAGEVLTEVTAPITTFANTRTAHGVSAVERLRTNLHSFIHDCPRLVIQVRISPDDEKQLSMSWWESPLVQRRIHRQTERSQNPSSGVGAEKNQNLPHLEAIWKELHASSCGPKGANGN